MQRATRFFARNIPVALAAVLWAILSPEMVGQTSAIPATVQLRLFAKIWMFDRSIPENGQIVMAVLYQPDFRASDEAKKQLAEAVRADGSRIRCIPVAVDDAARIASQLEHVKADVFYVTEIRGLNVLDVTRFSRLHHVKTITVTPGYVESGIAIGLSVRNDKPVIIINLSAANAEGSDLTAQLLSVSTVINRTAERIGTTQ